MQRDRLFREVVRAADAFFALRPWQQVSERAFFAVEIAGEGPLLAMVLGSEGQYGLQVVRGVDALQDLYAFGLHLKGIDEIRGTAFAVTLERSRSVMPAFRKVLQVARREGQMVPCFFGKEPEAQEPRPAKPAELEVLLRILRGVSLLHEAGRLAPRVVESGGEMTVYTLGGKPTKPTVSVDSVAVPEMDADLQDLVGVDDEQVDELRDLDFVAERYVVGTFTLDCDGGAVQSLLLVEPDGGVVGLLEPAVRSPIKACRLVVDTMCEGTEEFERGKPTRITASDPALYALLARVLEPAGVECELVEDDALLEPFIAKIRGAVVRLRGDEGLVAALAGDEDASEPSEMDHWKDIDRAVTEMVIDAGGSHVVKQPRRLAELLGTNDLERVEQILERFAQMAIAAAVEYHVQVHRPSRKAKTVLERLRARKDLDPDVRKCMDIRYAAPFSCYRIDAVHAGRGVELYDLLAEEEVFLHDYALSMSAREEQAFFARVYELPTGHCGVIVSPSIPLMHLESAFGVLEDALGRPVDAPLQPEDAWVFGLLFDWALDLSDRPPEMRNREGHRVAPRKLFFSVDDVAALRGALAARDDVFGGFEGDEGYDANAETVWTWADGLHGRASLELLDEDTLEVWTDSEERHEELCGWLEPIPGVRLERVEEQDLSGPAPPVREATGPVDVRPIEPTDPALVAQLQEVIDEHAMGWLDQEIPALDGKTPREACQTAEGRARVKRMIRTYPDPRGVPGVKAPRERMLAELGLDGPAREAGAE